MSIREAAYREFYPLVPVYDYDDRYTLKSRVLTYEDGYTASLSPLLSGVKDVAMNKKTLLLLTQPLQFGDIFDISTKSLDVNNLYFKSSLYTLDTAHFFVRVDYDTNKLFVDSWHAGNDTFFLFRSVPYPFSFQQRPVMQVWVSRPLHQATKTGLLTISRTYPYELTIQDPIWNDAWSQQHFDYWVTGNIIQLRSKVVDTAGNFIQAFIGYDRNDVLEPSRLKIIGDNNHNYDFGFSSPDNTQQFTTTNYNGTTYWIKYLNDFVNQEDNKSVEIDADQSIKGVPINLLCTSPYEQLDVIEVGGDPGTIPVNLNTLKNFQTPEYEYTDNAFSTSFYRISGRVLVQTDTTNLDDLTVEGATPLANVVMHGFPTTVVTDADGTYSSLVEYDFAAAIYPDEPNFTFSPSGLDVINLSSNLGTDFLGAVKTIPLSGHVVDNSMVPLSGVKVVTSSSITPATTDLSGNYILNVPWNWNGTLALSASFTGTFTPSSVFVYNVTDTVIQDFTKN